MSRFSRPAVLLLLTLGVLACADGGPDALLAPDAADAHWIPGGSGTAEAVTVMSQNMYLGADIDLLLSSQTESDVAQVFQQLNITTAGNFGRALQLATEIATEAPHLVGLQEVTRYTFNTEQGPQVLDFLTVLLGYLDYLNAIGVTPYTWSPIRHELTQVTVPASDFGPFPDVVYEDGDAILVRNDVGIVGEPTMVIYDAREVFSVAGTSFANVRGYMVVTADVGLRRIRFANTHLEIQAFARTQVAQARELIRALAHERDPVILVGDFNSAANRDAPVDAKTLTYPLLRLAGYADLWLRELPRESGVTCCQAADLLNPESQLTQRLDLVLARWGPLGFVGRSDMNVVGDEPGDRITVDGGSLGFLTVWPSDHAGVAATLWPLSPVYGRW